MEEIKWSDVPNHSEIIMKQASTGKEIEAVVKCSKKKIYLSCYHGDVEIYMEYYKNYENNDIKYFINK